MENKAAPSIPVTRLDNGPWKYWLAHLEGCADGCRRATRCAAGTVLFAHAQASDDRPLCLVCTSSPQVWPPLCAACLQVLSDPGAVQRAVTHMERIARDHGGVFAHDAEDARRNIVGRLRAERAAQPLTAAELAEADTLAAKFTAFKDLAGLADAAGGYWPKLDVTRHWQRDRDTREQAARLADLYDQHQQVRGDKRRATRNGIAGL